MTVESFDYNEIRGEEAKQSARHPGFEKSKANLWGPTVSLHRYSFLIFTHDRNTAIRQK